MSIALATLESRLQAKIVARDDVPADYGALVMDAVLQFSQDAPLIRTAEISIVSGTALYDLPSDFLSVIDLESLRRPGNVLITNEGIIPLGANWEERWFVEGSQIRFDPAPTYTTSRRMRYAALYELGSDEKYALLTENGARVALLYAQHLAIVEQANVVAGDGWRYQIGDEMVDKSNQGKSMMGAADNLLKQYKAAIKRSYGSRASYVSTELPSWA
jgi:hypothetical protein